MNINHRLAIIRQSTDKVQLARIVERAKRLSLTFRAPFYLTGSTAYLIGATAYMRIMTLRSMAGQHREEYADTDAYVRQVTR